MAVSIEDLDGIIDMKIIDDGKGFDTEGAESNNRLSMLDMRERIEMLGGAFRVESAPGTNNTVAEFKNPKSGARRRASKKSSRAPP